MVALQFIPFARISIKNILNRPITKFYNRDDVNATAGTDNGSLFYKKQFIQQVI